MEEIDVSNNIEVEVELSPVLEVTATSPTTDDGEHTADRANHYVNSRTPAPNTGVILHNAPFLIMLLLALFGLGMWRLSIKKRRNS